MKKKFKTAQQMFEQICALYLELDPNKSEFIFNNFHDDMQIQRDGANKDLSEMEYYMEYKKEKAFEMCYDNILKTLEYCTALIKLQKHASELPNSIYG